jgi:actinin alpha
LLDYEKCSKSTPRENLNYAFEVAEKELGIPRLLEPEDLIDTARPDERSIITYVSEVTVFKPIFELIRTVLPLFFI